MRLLLAATLALFALTSATSAKIPQNEEERKAAIKALTWRDGEAMTLPISRGSLGAPQNIRQLLGPDAVSLWEILNGTAAPTGTEAALYDPKLETIVFFQKLGSGYVRIDDWEDVDADGMLKSVKEATEEDNAKRRAAGIAPVHVTGWLERPHLDRATHTVRWTFEGSDEKDGPIVNSVALVLGRDGFEKLIWVGTKDTVNDGLLKTAQDSFSFASGERYADYKSGDKVAEYGIAGLVAAVMGAKTIGKLGALAALAVLAKKFGVFLLVPVVALIGWGRRYFTRNK